MLLDVSESQLVLVDYQARLMPAIFEGPLVLANARFNEKSLRKAQRLAFGSVFEVTGRSLLLLELQRDEEA